MSTIGSVPTVNCQPKTGVNSVESFGCSKTIRSFEDGQVVRIENGVGSVETVESVETVKSTKMVKSSKTRSVAKRSSRADR